MVETKEKKGGGEMRNSYRVEGRVLRIGRGLLLGRGHTRQVLDDFLCVFRLPRARLAGAEDGLIFPVYKTKAEGKTLIETRSVYRDAFDYVSRRRHLQEWMGLTCRARR